MTDYTPQEIEDALVVVEEASEEAASQGNYELPSGSWQEIGDGYGGVPKEGITLKLRGEDVTLTYEGGKQPREGGGEQVYAVVKVGDQYFRKPGYYMSHDGSYWDGTLFEVEPSVQTVTDYQKKVKPATDYTVKEVEKALLPYVGQSDWSEDLTEEEEEAASNADGWFELKYKLKGQYLGEGESQLTHFTIRGEQVPVEFVANFGGEGQGDDLWIVFKVGDQLFRKDGYYASYGESDYDGDLREVRAVVKAVTVYE